ncbi:MAG: DUF4388 domain-containing protein [Bdellovibrionota bacterium]
MQSSVKNRISSERISGSEIQRDFSLENHSKGSLKQFPSRFLIATLHHQKFTGTLSFSVAEKRKKVWFHQGEIFRIQSNLVPELLGRMMIARQWITEEDLKSCLSLQAEMPQQSEEAKPIGLIISENFGIDEDEISSLLDQQRINSFLQAFSWEAGDYEISSLDFKNPPPAKIEFNQLIRSIDSLFELNQSAVYSFLNEFETWQPSEGMMDLGRIPFWTVLASCRRLALSGLLCIRRSNKLYEIVFKHGVPLTYYEGTIAQPRQVICVRRASDDHERFFIDQVFQMFSFLSGSIYFKNLGESEANGHGPINIQFRDETAVTRNVSSFDLVQGQVALFKLFWSKLKLRFFYVYDRVRLKIRRLLRR